MENVTDKMELRLINPNEDGFLQHIDWNMDEIKAQVQTIMTAYTDVVYTEDTMKSAKDDRATLNKFRKAIEDRRKEVKNKCLEPYNRFEAEVKEVVALIDEPLGIIDRQIKDYEEQQKAEKKAKIEEAYKNAIGDLADVLPFEKVFDQRYLNTTYALAKAIGEISEKIIKVKTDLETIDSMESEYKLNVKDVYVKTLDLSKAMAEERRLKDLKEKLEADKKAKEEAEAKRLAQEAERRAAAEEREKAEAEERAKREAEETQRREAEEKARQEAEAAKAAQPEAPAPQPEVKKYKATFYCIGTMEQIQALGKYMTDNGIEFGKVGK